MHFGKLLVIEGIDGSGKTTQIELLKKFLNSQQVQWETISFPQYGKNKYAEEIVKYLEGKLGNLNEVNPYKIAKLYASDRGEAKDLINSWLKEGKLVIANRYISSSKAHLGANLPGGQREDFFKWLNKLEYEDNGIPKEDLTIILDVDPKIGQRNVIEKQGEDIHEHSLKHLEEARKIYLDLSKTENNWIVVDCMDNEEMKNQISIHKLLVEKLVSELLS